MPFSYDVQFPNHTHGGELEQALHTIEEIFSELNPRFIALSATNAGAVVTHRVVELAADYGPSEKLVPVVCWPTWERQPKPIMQKLFERLGESGVKSVLIKDANSPKPTVNEVTTTDLVHLAQDSQVFGSVGAVASASLTSPYTKRAFSPEHKGIDSFLAADFVITQPIGDRTDYWSGVHDLTMSGIAKPVIPGIKPDKDISAFVSKTIAPRGLYERILNEIEDPSGLNRDLEHILLFKAISLGSTLLNEGVPSLHIYTGNNPKLTVEVVEAINAECAA